MRRKLLFFISFFALNTTLGAASSDRSRLVEVITAQPQQITKKIKLIGTIRAQQESHLYAQIPGVVEKIYVQTGMPVKAKDLLVSLENETLLKVYNLSVTNEMLARKQYERSKGLEGKGYVSTSGLEELERDWILAQITSEQAKQEFEKTFIRAPFDGYCGTFKVTEGASVKTQDEIVTVYDPSQLLVEFGIPENLIFKVRPEQAIYAAGNKGVIISVQNAIDVVTHMGVARAQLKGDNLVVGMTVDVELITDQRNQVIGLPTEAIFLANGAPHIYRVENNKATLTPITIGLQGNSLVEVTQGLAPGDLIILRGQASLYDGCPVKIYNEEG